MADSSATELDDLARGALSIGDIASAAIFVVEPGSEALRLGAASGIAGPALDGLVAAVQNPAHPVARAVSDDGPTFDVLPTAPGGPRLRSHLPLQVPVDEERVTVGVLAVAHDSALDADQRSALIQVADRAAAAIGR